MTDDKPRKLNFLCRIGLHISGPNEYERDDLAKALVAVCKCKYCPTIMNIWMKLDNQGQWRQYDSRVLDRRAEQIIQARALGRELGELLVHLANKRKKV